MHSYRFFGREPVLVGDRPPEMRNSVADPDKKSPDSYEFEIPTMWVVTRGRSETRSRGDDPVATAE
jgi:hypothetical protein